MLALPRVLALFRVKYIGVDRDRALAATVRSLRSDSRRRFHSAFHNVWGKYARASTEHTPNHTVSCRVFVRSLEIRSFLVTVAALSLMILVTDEQKVLMSKTGFSVGPIFMTNTRYARTSAQVFFSRRFSLVHLAFFNLKKARGTPPKRRERKLSWCIPSVYRYDISGLPFSCVMCWTSLLPGEDSESLLQKDNGNRNVVL